MRAFLAVALLLVCALVSVSAVADEAPVPEGLSLPNIFNPVTDRADGREQAKALVGLVAKEPQVAYGVGNEKEGPIEDTWNGESDPESGASVAQKKMLKEVSSLEALIAQGQKILKVLPRKQKRLDLLKKKLSVILDAKAKREASEKLDQQQALLDAIKKREGMMSSRLKGLTSAQTKLEESVQKLKGVIDGQPNVQAAGPRRAVANAAAGARGAAPQARFLELGMDSEEQAAIGGELETQEELEQEAAVDQEAEMEMAAEEQ
jgi:hypothetical protein